MVPCTQRLLDGTVPPLPPAELRLVPILGAVGHPPIACPLLPPACDLEVHQQVVDVRRAHPADSRGLRGAEEIRSVTSVPPTHTNPSGIIRSPPSHLAHVRRANLAELLPSLFGQGRDLGVVDVVWYRPAHLLALQAGNICSQQGILLGSGRFPARVCRVPQPTICSSWNSCLRMKPSYLMRISAASFSSHVIRPCAGTLCKAGTGRPDRIRGRPPSASEFGNPDRVRPHLCIASSWKGDYDRLGAVALRCTDSKPVQQPVVHVRPPQELLQRGCNRCILQVHVFQVVCERWIGQPASCCCCLPGRRAGLPPGQCHQTREHGPT